MEKLFQIFSSRVQAVDASFRRYLWYDIDWNNRLIAITGARGAGKTTLLLQYIKANFSNDLGEVFYASLDNLYFTKTTLSVFADDFVKQGGKFLFLDEVHKYPDWSREIKNIYDNYPQLSIVFTGSSALDIFRGNADLSRRLLHYTLSGLSFREFIEMKYHHRFPVFSLTDVTEQAFDISMAINPVIKPVKLFEEYQKIGYYPFFAEDEKNYTQRLLQTINQTLESDLPAVAKIGYSSVYALRKLFAVIAETVPFKPNILKLSQQIGIDRETLLKYLHLLSTADLLLLFRADTRGISQLKPDKVYLNNANMMYALAESPVNTGTMRETFFYNQTRVRHAINYTNKGDFLVDRKLVFEVGGNNKTQQQIAGIPHAFIAADNIEYPYKNTIPIWMFGFLY
jgi:predicted AAA+ superfamily ATPase